MFHQLASEFIRDNVQPGNKVHTDEFKSYLWLDSFEFTHGSESQ